MSEIGVAAATEQPDIPALIHRCLQGDQPSYALLYDHYATGVYRLCYSLLLNRSLDFGPFFLYAAALANGYTPATLINDAPLARSDLPASRFTASE